MTPDDFNRFLRLEPYFSEFPVYYWNIWEAVSVLDPSSREHFVPVLERIITLDKNGVYAKRAWDGITGLMGFSQ